MLLPRLLMEHARRSTLLLAASALSLASRAGAQVPEATLMPGDPAFPMGFGHAVCLDGERALIGAPFLGNFAGAAYVFEQQAGTWVQVAKLVASDGASGDTFASTVALDGERALVGAPLDDNLFVNAGAVYVFAREAGSWVQTAKLLSGADVGFFGSSVALEGERALAGSFQAAFVFELQGGAWLRTAKLLAGDIPAGGLFGSAVSLSGDRALAGAPHNESAYLFELQGSAWVETAKLVASSGPAYDYFGGSVSLEGDRALIGAVQEIDLGTGLGSARVFDLAAGTWIESAVLVPTDPDPAKRFANSVSLRGDSALVGAPGDQEAGIHSGAAYFYRRAVGGAWTQVAKLAAPAPEDHAEFGLAVSLGAGRALVGAWGVDPGGAAYSIDISHVEDALQAGPAQVPLGSGGLQHLALNAGPAYQGRVYWLLGSTSGVAPGIPLGGGVSLPLNPDAYLFFGVQHPNHMPLSHSLGLLGVTGQASAAFWLPPGTDPSLAGTTLHHAYAVIDLLATAVVAASNPVAVQLIP